MEQKKMKPNIRLLKDCIDIVDLMNRFYWLDFRLYFHDYIYKDIIEVL